MEEKIEIMNLLQNKQLLEHELQSLAYGSVEIRENDSNKYIYVHYREDGVVLTKYVGEYSDELYNLVLNNSIKAKELKKQIKEINKPQEMLEIWDEKLAEYGEKVYLYRKEFVDKIINKINDIHKKITDEKEELKIEYISNCSNKKEYLNLLNERRKLDIIKGFTTKGVHRDDFVIYINNREVGVYGSQGQNRTVILSLKLSELNVVYDEIGEYPILLLDDFMSELDEKRRKNFLENIENTQVIITGTDKVEISTIDCSLYNVQKGEIV